MLVAVKVAASHNQVSPNLISYLAQKGHIKKHYIYGNQRHYAVDLDEVTLQLELGRQRRFDALRGQTNWTKQVRNKDGTFAKKTR